MMKHWFHKATVVLTAGVVATLGYGLYQAADARAKDPVVSAALDGPTVAGVCGNTELLAGPATAPEGAVVVTASLLPDVPESAPRPTVPPVATPIAVPDAPTTIDAPPTTTEPTITTDAPPATTEPTATEPTLVLTGQDTDDASATTSTEATMAPTTTTTAVFTPDASVATDDTLQAAIDANPPGTTFYLPDPLYRFTGSVTPKTGDTFVGGPATVIDGGGTARAAFKAGVDFSVTPWGMADDVTITSLTIQHFAALNDQVVVNVDAGDGWTLDRVTLQDNKGGAVMMGSRNTIMNSCLTRNGQYGFNTYRCRGYDDGGCATTTTVTDLTITHSEIAYNDTDQLAITQPGCGCSGGGKFWDVRGARVTDNWVHHNNSAGLWADTNDTDFLFQGNVIEDNDGAGIFYEISYNARIVDNTFRRNAIGQGARRLAENEGDHFPDGAIYISESGGDAAAVAAARARGESWNQVNDDQDTLEIAGNTFEDNWNGVVLWESSDRYCSSVANTSTGYCTLYYGSYEPGGANKAACTDPVLTGVALDQCRWKTQNVDVHNNLFTIDRDAVGHGCSDSDDHCGRNAIFSQWGVFPSYPAEMVQRKILFDQNNEFRRNIYRGTWRFTAFDQAQSSVRDLRTWSAMAPENAVENYQLWNDPPDGLGQDAGSVRGPLPPPPTTTTTTLEPPTTTEPPTTEPTEPTTTTEPPITVGPPPAEPPTTTEPTTPVTTVPVTEPTTPAATTTTSVPATTTTEVLTTLDVTTTTAPTPTA